MKLVRKILVAMLLGTMAIQVAWADINEDFLNAASLYQCDLDKVKQLLRLGADVNVDNGKAFINAHSCSKAIEIMEYLISQGLDINAKGGYGTVLDDTLVASFNSATNYNLIKYLVSKGANVNVRVSKSENTLFRKMLSYPPVAIEHIDTIEYVLSKGAVISAGDLDRLVNAFEYKMRVKKMSAKEWAVIKLAIKNTKNLDYCSGMDHNIGLYDYNKEGKDKVDDLLLQNGLDINHQCESSGYTRLMETYNLDKVKYLISKGADVNIKDKNGETALTKALNAKKYDTAEFLISKGAKK